jgi:hypothetical protein
MTLNQRLDQMGPHYRAASGLLSRALAIIEDAEGSNPPYMSPDRLELVHKCVVEAAAKLEAQKGLRG